jgi:hypothetical protein
MAYPRFEAWALRVDSGSTLGPTFVDVENEGSASLLQKVTDEASADTLNCAA